MKEARKTQADAQGAAQEDGVLRKPSLIANGTGKMAKTYVGGAVCAATVTIVDTLVAGVSIGPAALAAIAAAAPLLTIDQILHCMFGVGIDRLMVQAIGEGRRKEANRIFGAILLAVIVVYVVVFALLIFFVRPILGFVVEDPGLIDMVIDYTIPLFIAAPVFEAFLCIERAFRIDGRAKLFSKRAIITNIANIIFDILLVSVLGLSVTGLAWASVISTALGYTVSLSHFFSKKRTVSPDFSVFFSLRELLSYVKQDMRLGSSATLDEVLSSVALTLQTTAISVLAGPGGLAVWAVFKSLRGVVVSASNGVSASVSVHAGLLYGQKDYEGIRYAVKTGIRIALMVSLAAVLIVFFLAGQIAFVYHVEPEYQELATQCMQIGCMLFPALALLTVVHSYLPAVDRLKLTNAIVIVQQGLVIVAAGIAFVASLQVFFVAYVVAIWAASLFALVFFVRDGHWFVPERNPEMVADYSIQLKPAQISALGIAVRKELDSFGYPASFCSRVALVIEDAVSYIAQHDANEAINVDVGVKRYEDGILLTVLDDGPAYNPLAQPSEAEWSEPGAIESAVILAFAENVEYDRMLDLNYLSAFVKPHVKP